MHKGIKENVLTSASTSSLTHDILTKKACHFLHTKKKIKLFIEQF